MPREASKASLLQGTLDLLILRTLLFGPIHGHGIAKHIQRTSEDVLQVEHGSLYPALQRLERSGCITSKWEVNERGKELKLYRLTTKGRKMLRDELASWKHYVATVSGLLDPG